MSFEVRGATSQKIEAVNTCNINKVIMVSAVTFCFANLLPLQETSVSATRNYCFKKKKKHLTKQNKLCSVFWLFVQYPDQSAPAKASISISESVPGVGFPTDVASCAQ